MALPGRYRLVANYFRGGDFFIHDQCWVLTFWLGRLMRLRLGMEHGRGSLLLHHGNALLQKGTKAPQAAGKIHTDFEKGFIMAEVMKFSDFKEEGSEAAVKAAGKYRQQGRNYVVEDGDIIFFKFNAGAGLKDAKKK